MNEFIMNHILDLSTAVLNLLRLEDHLQTLPLGRGPPLKIVPWKIAKIGLFVFISLKNQKVAFARGPPSSDQWSSDHRLRTAALVDIKKG